MIGRGLNIIYKGERIMTNIAERMKIAQRGDSGIVSQVKKAISAELTEDKFGDYLVGLVERGECPVLDELNIYFLIGISRTTDKNTITFKYSTDYRGLKSIKGKDIEIPLIHSVKANDRDIWGTYLLAQHIESIVRTFDGIKIIEVTAPDCFVDDDANFYYYPYRIKMANPIGRGM